MNTKMLAGIAVLALIVGYSIVALGGHHAAPTKTNASTTYVQAQGAQASNQTNTNYSEVLFANTAYAPYSYVAYPGPPSQQAQAALAGFNLTSTALQNGSTEIKIMLVGTNLSRSLTLKPNYKLYIIEINFADDGYSYDSSLDDDRFVVVDPNGYMVDWVG